MDAEWASDEVLADALALFSSYHLPVSVFATHSTPLLQSASATVEVGLHPNFLTTSDHEGHIAELLAAYPEAKGVRTHGLFEYSNLFNLFRASGLAWDAGQQLWMQPGLMPYRHPSGMVRLPMYWEDDDYLALEPDWSVESLALQAPGVKCLDFHPLQLSMNVYKIDQLHDLKRAGYTLDAVRGLTYHGRDKGIRILFEQIAEYIFQQRIPVALAGEVCAWV